ncbi:MAG: hypothetical protein IPG17_14785 [Sandaracinaceae bacterium]|nr:hypothetical protein [Sandaracinaceae bacterium]
MARRALGADLKRPSVASSLFCRWQGPVSAVAHPREGERFVVLEVGGGVGSSCAKTLVVAFEEGPAGSSATLPLGAASGAFLQLAAEPGAWPCCSRSCPPEWPGGRQRSVRARRLVGWTGRLFLSADGARLVFRARAWCCWCGD